MNKEDFPMNLITARNIFNSNTSADIIANEIQEDAYNAHGQYDFTGDTFDMPELRDTEQSITIRVIRERLAQNLEARQLERQLETENHVEETTPTLMTYSEAYESAISNGMDIRSAIAWANAYVTMNGIDV